MNINELQSKKVGLFRKNRDKRDLWVELDGGVRRCLVRRFPYAVLYSKDSGQLFILAIMHTKRKPGYWLNRRNAP